MDILLITINYPPEIGGAAHLIHELALSLKKRGHQVTVLTNYPSYNLKVIPSQYQRGLRMDETWEGIPVRRIRVPSLPRESRIARGLQHIIFGLWLAVLTAITPRADVALVFSPPLPLPWLVCLMGKVRRMPVVVNIQDLFPREAVELGMLTNPLLIRLFEGMERQMHRLATAITVHSPGNREHVIAHGGRPDEVHVVYNWINTERIRPGRRDNDFAREYGLLDRFVVSYAGTMGWAQDMGTIIASADRLRDRPDVLFLLVGDGVEKEKAQSRSAELGLTNTVWLPMQPWAVYPDVLAASDVSLINLRPELRTPVVPSKLLSIMAAARPVVASLPAQSDARRIIAESGCGFSVEAGDSQALADQILTLYADRTLLAEMGQRARAYVEAHFSQEVCIDQMEAILRHAAGGTP
jgi:putative colanic acid biosynthesis glycosyltransferase WcaI